jgi:uncharacterized protein (DUF2141 family)
MASRQSSKNDTLKYLGMCALATLFAAGNARAADLTVNVKGIKSQKGNVLVVLYDSANTFLKPGAQAGVQVSPVQATEASVVFRDLPAGRYALTAFHDENANGKLDFNISGSPLEAVGFSNDAMGTARAPLFDQAAVGLDANTAITVNLH